MSELPFGFEKPEDSPGFLLWQTTMEWQRRIKRALEPFDISHAQFVVMALMLWFEEHEYDSTQGLIVKWSKLDKMTVSKSMKKLTAKQLVDRSEHKVDSRTKSVCLTREGKHLIHELVPLVEAIDKEFFGRVSEEQQQSLIKVLGRLSHCDHTY